MNTNVDLGISVIMMYQCRFMDSNKGTTLVGGVDNGELYMCRGGRS